MNSSIRLFTWDDLPAVADVMNAYFESLTLTSRVKLETIEPRWRAPYNHPEKDCFLGFSPDGKLIGFTIADLHDEPEHADGIFNVVPGYPEVTRPLIRAAEQHFEADAIKRGVSADVPHMMTWTLSDKAEHGIAVLQEMGYQYARTFYTMRIMLDTPIEPVSLPSGLVLRPFEPAHLETVHAAAVEAFAEHWGETNLVLSEWQSDLAAPDFDPSLWWVAYDGDQVAGMALCRQYDQVGSVGILGVQRPWRKLGLGYALLRTVFAEFQRRGLSRAELGVDSTNQTNAVSLYQRAGMSIHSRTLYFQKDVRSASA